MLERFSGLFLPTVYELDFSLNDQGVETRSVPTPDGEIEIEIFSEKTNQWLKEHDCPIYLSTGGSIKSLAQKGRIVSDWHNQYPEFETVTSRLSEVAFLPHQCFLPEKGKKTRKQQERMNQEILGRLREEDGIRNIDVIIGSIGDYTQLALSHFDTKGKQLLDVKNKDGFIITTTMVNSGLVSVRYEIVNKDLYVHGWWFRNKDNNFGTVLPLLVPSPK